MQSSTSATLLHLSGLDGLGRRHCSEAVPIKKAFASYLFLNAFGLLLRIVNLKHLHELLKLLDRFQAQPGAKHGRGNPWLWTLYVLQEARGSR